MTKKTTARELSETNKRRMAAYRRNFRSLMRANLNLAPFRDRASVAPEGLMFVRMVWGDLSDPQSRVHKTYQDIDNYLERETHLPREVVYVFAQEHKEQLVERGFDVRCLQAPDGMMGFSHRFFAWQDALQRHQAIISLDWDVVLRQPVDLQLLCNGLNRRTAYQSTLILYKNPKASWRTKTARYDIRKVPGGAFVFLGDSRLATLFMAGWKVSGFMDEEVLGAALTDLAWGGWIDRGWMGLDAWWDRHECPFSWNKTTPFRDRAEEKDVIFVAHF